MDSAIVLTITLEVIMEFWGAAGAVRRGFPAGERGVAGELSGVPGVSGDAGAGDVAGGSLGAD